MEIDLLLTSKSWCSVLALSWKPRSYDSRSFCAAAWVVLIIVAPWYSACNLHALYPTKQTFNLSFLNNNLIPNIYQTNVFKELAHLVS